MQLLDQRARRHSDKVEHNGIRILIMQGEINCRYYIHGMPISIGFRAHILCTQLKLNSRQEPRTGTNHVLVTSVIQSLIPPSFPHSPYFINSSYFNVHSSSRHPTVYSFCCSRWQYYLHVAGPSRDGRLEPNKYLHTWQSPSRVSPPAEIQTRARHTIKQSKSTNTAQRKD